MTETRRRSFWGWGYEGEQPDPAQLALAEAALPALLGVLSLRPRRPPDLSTLDLPPPRVQQPPALARMFAGPDPDQRRVRATHTYGRSYRDLVRALDGDFRHAPDLVAYPAGEQDIIDLLDYAAAHRLAVLPYGGGTSVCGGVEPDVGPGYAGTISLDMSRLSSVAEVDPAGRAARIQGGTLGPDIEDALRPSGLTLRHFPQSFAVSTLGGWIATRSGGHFATLYTHIDDLVESVRVVTGRGVIQTRRLPASGAGPAPERLFLGSEGALGVITEAWVRLHERPRFRASATVTLGDFLQGARLARALAQSGLYPSNCRLLDPTEALLSGAAQAPGQALLLCAFESADHPVGPWLSRALECARDHGGTVLDSRETQQAPHIGTEAGADTGTGASTGPAERWRATFLRAPYLRDALVLRGLLCETFETAVTWDRFAALHESVVAATRAALQRECGGAGGLIGCRLTHVYPDGAAPYYTVIAPARRGAELRQWDAIKEQATGAILEHSGTTTHHHAVGRDFRAFYERERPAAFGSALAAVKRELDPAWVLNPGALLAPAAGP